MLEGVYFFRNTSEIPGIFDRIFGGMMVAKTIPSLTQMGIILGTIAICALTYVSTTPGKVRWRRFIWPLAGLVFLATWLMLLQPWDELFVNLRHSRHLAEHGTFSFNLHQRLEGTADFLPYFVIGWLTKLGADPVTTSLLMSLAGGLLCFYVATLFLRAWESPGWATRAWVPLLFLPSLLYNSAQGFSTTVFAATALGALYGIFYGRAWLGLLLLASLGLVRVEGVWLALLVGVALVWGRGIFSMTEVGGKRGARLLIAVAVLLPSIALALFRKSYFGEWLPLPVQYKASFGNLFYFVLGVRNLAADLVAGYGASALGILLVCRYAAGGERKRRDDSLLEPRELAILILLAAFVAPYYLSGGDWFPPHWGRYLFPLTLFLILLAWHHKCVIWFAMREEKRWGFALAALAIFAVPTLWPQSGLARLWRDIFPARRTLARLFDQHSLQARVNHLSQLGLHLKETTEPGAVIASSEVATVMYFAEREALDLLGVANPELIATPPRTPPPLFHRFQSSELPYSIFRRVKPAIIGEHKPEVVYTFDFTVRDLFEDLKPNELGPANVMFAADRWTHRFRGLVGPLYGGVAALEKQGYRAVVIGAGERFTSLYFVSAAALPGHLAKLKAAGFSGGWVKR